MTSQLSKASVEAKGEAQAGASRAAKLQLEIDQLSSKVRSEAKSGEERKTRAVCKERSDELTGTRALGNATYPGDSIHPSLKPS